MIDAFNVMGNVPNGVSGKGKGIASMEVSRRGSAWRKGSLLLGIRYRFYRFISSIHFAVTPECLSAKHERGLILEHSAV